jgi:heme-binding protein
VPANCTVSGIANTSITVSASTSVYPASHPDTNQELTAIASQPQEQATEDIRVYLAGNPQVEPELKAIHQPIIERASQCGINVTPTPISEALQIT